MNNNRLATFLICVASALLSVAVQAQPAQPDCADNTACLSLFEQAQQQSKAGNLAEAQRLYKLAYEVEPDPALLFSIARVMHKQGLTQEAISFYRRFLSSGSNDDVQKTKARNYLVELEPEVKVPPPSTALPPPPGNPPISTAVESKPVYKKWWFWTIIGGVVAGGVIGAAVGAVSAKSSSPTDPIRPGAPVYMPTF